MSGEQQGSKAGKGYGYRDLVVWQKGIDLAKRIYRATQRFPNEEKFGLVSQMRRAAVSVPSNIAEGQARHTTKEFIQFVSHAEGSLAELDTQLRLGVELGYCPNGESAEIGALIDEVRRMLNGLRRNLSARGA
ncbi:MAG TPA: four helix bundle protein [Terriglobia bacterium]|nr:four helix bundle protein [Terriglobia bacterium]